MLPDHPIDGNAASEDIIMDKLTRTAIEREDSAHLALF